MANIEEHIRKAIEEGKFENLPGMGKSLQLDENPFEDPGWRLAHRVLKNAGFTLPWLETRREIEAALAAARNELKRAWRWQAEARQRGVPTAEISQQWERDVETFERQIGEINKHISAYNLEAPSDRFQLAILSVERELWLTTSDQSDTLAGT